VREFLAEFYRSLGVSKPQDDADYLPRGGIYQVNNVYFVEV
jgi:hypothetical protein